MGTNFPFGAALDACVGPLQLSCTVECIDDCKFTCPCKCVYLTALTVFTLITRTVFPVACFFLLQQQICLVVGIVSVVQWMGERVVSEWLAEFHCNF